MQPVTGATLMTAEEYLSMERESSTRHEFVNGRVYAMSGTTKRHNKISVNLSSILHSHLRGSDCNVFVSDVKLRVEASNCYYYPDLMVECGSANDDEDIANRPALVIEILSRSTAAIDRREKAIAYETIQSLKEYLIVAQASPKVELHRKEENERWRITEYAAGDEFTLNSIHGRPLRLTVNEIYERVNWGAAGSFRVKEETETYDLEDPDW